MEPVKVKVFSYSFPGKVLKPKPIEVFDEELEAQINAFIADKELVDIKLQTTGLVGGHRVIALVTYRDFY